MLGSGARGRKCWLRRSLEGWNRWWFQENPLRGAPSRLRVLISGCGPEDQVEVG